MAGLGYVKYNIVNIVLIMHMTKVTDSVSAATVIPADAGMAGAPGQRSELVWTVATMISDWEGSDELATEFAEHLVDFFLGHATEGLSKEKNERAP